MRRMRCIALAAAAAFSPLSIADAIDDAMTNAGCMACHAVDKRLLGPSFKEIAAKRKGDADAVTTLVERVRKGGPSVYGLMPKSPTGPDRINDADLKGAIEKILKS